MTALIPIREHDGHQAVSGRELHAFLEVGAEYAKWFSRMAEYGFADGEDFSSILTKTPEGGRPSTDHALTLDMAKELAMIQRTPRGQEARRYFIEVEKRARAIAVPQTLPEALRAYAAEVEQRQALEAKVAEDAPKVLFADVIGASDQGILVRELAKLLQQNGIEIGEKRLYERLRQDGYLIRARGTDWNMPTQRSMQAGLFLVKETPITHSDGRVTISKTSKVTGKGQTYFINRYQETAA